MHKSRRRLAGLFSSLGDYWFKKNFFRFSISCQNMEKFAFEPRFATLLLILLNLNLNSIARNLTKWESGTRNIVKVINATISFQWTCRVSPSHNLGVSRAPVRQQMFEVLIVQSFHWNGFVRSPSAPQSEPKPFTSRTFSVPTSYYQNKAKAQHYDCHLTFFRRCLLLKPQPMWTSAVLYERAQWSCLRAAARNWNNKEIESKHEKQN